MTGLLSYARMTSPTWSPAFAAGLVGATSDTNPPCARSIPSASASGGVIGWTWTPSQPRITRPVARSCAITGFAAFDGIANPMPTLPPLGEKIAVLMPITWPFRSKVGPPELPWLIDASICR